MGYKNFATAQENYFDNSVSIVPVSSLVTFEALCWETGTLNPDFTSTYMWRATFIENTGKTVNVNGTVYEICKMRSNRKGTTWHANIWWIFFKSGDKIEWHDYHGYWSKGGFANFDNLHILLNETSLEPNLVSGSHTNNEIRDNYCLDHDNSSDSIYAIRIPNYSIAFGGKTYTGTLVIPVAIEEDVTIQSGIYTYENVINPVPDTFDIGQQILFDVTPAVTIVNNSAVVNSNGYSLTPISSQVASPTFESSYDTMGDKKANAIWEGGTYEFTIHIRDYPDKHYEIRENEGVPANTVFARSGQEVGSSFLNNHSLVWVERSPYAEKTTKVVTPLDKTKMDNTMFKESDTKFEFNYDISDIAGDGAPAVHYELSSSPHLVKLASGSAKFVNLNFKTAYGLGEVVHEDLTDISGGLTYTDGQTIPIENIIFDSAIVTMKSGQTNYPLPHTVDVDTPLQFDITFVLSNPNFNQLVDGEIKPLEVTFSDCYTEQGARVFSAKLFYTKNNFKPNEIIDFGNDAYIELYNEAGELLKTITRNEFNRYVSYSASSLYTKPAKDYLQDGEVTLRAMVLNHEIVQKICFTYDELSLRINASGAKVNYIMPPDFDDFDYTNVIVKKVRHINEFVPNNSSVQTTIVESEDILESCIISHDPLDFTTSKTYAITVKFTNEYSQELSGVFNIQAEPLRALRLEISGDGGNSTVYYDNDQERFKLPSGMTFTVVYNDPAYNYTLDSLTGLRFFRDSNRTQVLTAGTSIIKRTDGNNIYVTYTPLNINGTYGITWLADNIVSVTLENPVQPYLGNRLSKIKGQVLLNCLRDSGVITQTTDFEFTDTSIILEEPETKEVRIKGINYEILNADTHISFQVPTAQMTFDTAGFQEVYNNQVDTIYPNKFKAIIKYYDNDGNECDYVQTATYSPDPTDAYDKFTVTGDSHLSGYNFGNEPLHIDMQQLTEINADIIVTSKNRFDDNNVNANLTVKIIELLDITGIKLLDTYVDYHIGDTFLNENDDTTIMLFYKDQNEVDRTFVCKLNVGLTGLNIYPTKGSKFTQIATGKVVTVTSATNYNMKVEYAINVSARYVQTNTKTHNLVALWIDNYTCPDEEVRSKYFLVERTIQKDAELYKETTQIDDETGERRIADGLSVEELSVLGYLEDVMDESKNARVILFKDYQPPIQGSNNITVKFPVYVEGNADLINKCHFGIMFGNNNAKNRLFVSGNPEYKNKDWHTGEISSDYIDDETMIDGNYGYFEDLSECSYGETDNAVIGYDIVSNDKLLVLKNQSDKETTVYFRTPQLVTAINGSGTAVTGLDDETLYQEEFALSKGNNTNAGIHPRAICNFNGDTVFLTKDKQLVGLDLTGIVGDNQRYANSRSYFIDQELMKQDFSEATIWTNNSYLAIILKDKLYVTHYEIYNEEQRQYEWFALDVANVGSMLEIDGKIYFGTKDGKFYMFGEEYADMEKVFAGYGMTKMSVNEETELIIATEYLRDLDLSKKHYFRPVPFREYTPDEFPHIYYSLGTIQNSSTADCDFYVNNGDNRNVLQLLVQAGGIVDNERREIILKRISENIPVYLNKINNLESVIACKPNSVFEQAFGKKYFLKEFNDDNNPNAILYQLVDENGSVMPVRELYRARLCLRVDREMEMANIDKDNGTFQLKDEESILDIVQYSSQSLTSAFAGQIIEYKNVEAYYITKPYTFGSLEYFKTIWSFTLTNDTDIPSEVELCYVSNKIPFEKMKTLAKISKDALGFDMDKFNFAKVDFDKRVAPRTYTNKRVLSQVKFVCFGIRNYNDTNAVLSSMSMTYTLPYPSYSGD